LIGRFLAVATLVAAALVLPPRVAGAQSLPSDESDAPTMQDLKALAPSAATKASELRKASNGIVQAGAIDPATYTLGPGDALQLELWGRLQRTVPLEVSPDGRLFIPGRGSIDVGGRTFAAVRDQILRSISDQYMGVRGDVRLVQLRTFKVFVSGEVKQPGAFEVNSVTRASEAVAQAELQEKSSRRAIVVRHVKGGTARVDLDRFEVLGQQAANPMLVDGDVIVVGKQLSYTEAGGAVARPQRYEFAEGDSLATLIALAGGLMPSARPDGALIVRFTSATDRDSIPVDLRDPATLARPLQDGDRLFVQFTPEYHQLTTVMVIGEAERPGTFPIVAGRDRLSDLIQWSGGFRPQANREAVHLVRSTENMDEKDPEFDRLARLSRNEMTESEYAKLETMLAQRKNSFRVDWTRLRAGSDTDPLLQDRDLVRIDRFVPSVRIEGQVRRPGFVDYAPGRDLGEYIQLAGGFTERSARNSIRVSRSLSGQIIPARSLKAVQPGDFIWVPERRDVDAWVAFRDIVTVAGQVAVVIFTLSRR